MSAVSTVFRIKVAYFFIKMSLFLHFLPPIPLDFQKIVIYKYIKRQNSPNFPQIPLCSRQGNSEAFSVKKQAENCHKICHIFCHAKVKFQCFFTRFCGQILSFLGYFSGCDVTLFCDFYDMIFRQKRLKLLRDFVLSAIIGPWEKLKF